jgi:hypothetical protein
LIAVGTLAASEGGYGSIEGSVLDVAGQPIAAARVYAITMQPSASITPTAVTDAAGKYVLEGVPAGLNMVAAGKREAGYADPVHDFADPSQAMPEVLVRPGQATKGVVIKLDRKAACIRGEVRDGETGALLRRGGIAFLHAEDPQTYMGTGVGRAGDFNILVPSFFPFRMRVSAPGYASWYYGPDGTEGHAEPLHLTPGETKQITVRLQPEKH